MSRRYNINKAIIYKLVPFFTCTSVCTTKGKRYCRFAADAPIEQRRFRFPLKLRCHFGKLTKREAAAFLAPIQFAPGVVFWHGGFVYV